MCLAVLHKGPINKQTKKQSNCFGLHVLDLHRMRRRRGNALVIYSEKLRIHRSSFELPLLLLSCK